MKVMLVVDLKDISYEAINDYFTGDVFLHLGADRYYDFQDVLLQPIPEELPTPYMMRQIMIADGIQTEKPPYTEEYQKGYNDCINEILGER